MKYLVSVLLIIIFVGCSDNDNSEQQNYSPQEVSSFQYLKGDFSKHNVNEIAIQNGFNGYQTGLSDLLDRLRKGFTDIEHEKDYLWGLVPNDSFKVSSIVDNFVIYEKYNDYNTKVAFLKDKNKFYQQGGELGSDVYFTIIGIQEFQTVTGATQQILVLKEIYRKYPKIEYTVIKKDK